MPAEFNTLNRLLKEVYEPVLRKQLESMKRITSLIPDYESFPRMQHFSSDFEGSTIEEMRTWLDTLPEDATINHGDEFGGISADWYRSKEE